MGVGGTGFGNRGATVEDRWSSVAARLPNGGQQQGARISPKSGTGATPGPKQFGSDVVPI